MEGILYGNPFSKHIKVFGTVQVSGKQKEYGVKCRMAEKDPLQSSIDEKMNHMVHDKEKQKERKKKPRNIVVTIAVIIFAVVMILRMLM